MSEENGLHHKIDRLNQIGISLSRETDNSRLMELILEGSMELTNADGGTIYRVTEDKKLNFEVIKSNSLNLDMGGTNAKVIDFPMVPLLERDKKNLSNVVSCCYHEDRTINIKDVYCTKDYDFYGTRKFDKSSGYRTQSMLAIPMKNHEKDIIGVLQLINALDKDKNVTTFNSTDQHLAESLSSQAAVTITNQELINSLQNLFDSFVKLIAQAIDEKSPYTGNHCRRIPILTMMLAEAVHENSIGVLKEFYLTDADRLELKTAAWLHDCGKITSPDYIMDKSTKLETVVDKMETVDLRFEVKIQQLFTQVAQHPEQAESIHKEIEELKKYRIFLRRVNIGGEFLSEKDKDDIAKIARIQYKDVDGIDSPLLTEEEKYNLSVSRGTLNSEERLVINNHMVSTIRMLESMPFPKHLKKVPEYAGGHHEKMDGTGYPKGLNRSQMSIPARIMAIADIFEALSASDRPYKKGKKVSDCLKIMHKMSEEQHVDSDLFDIFLKKNVWYEYAQSELQSDQIDITSWQELRL